MKVTILLSGGLDSTVCLYMAKARKLQITAVMVDYNQTQIKELDFATSITNELEVPWIKIPAYPWTRATNPQKSNEINWGVVDDNPMVIPGRNAVLISLAAAATQPDELWLGCNKDDLADYPDCRQQFADAIGYALGVKVILPLVGYSKVEIVGLAKSLGVPLDETLSCYRGRTPGCGRCNACKLRNEALNESLLSESS